MNFLRRQSFSFPRDVGPCPRISYIKASDSPWNLNIRQLLQISIIGKRSGLNHWQRFPHKLGTCHGFGDSVGSPEENKYPGRSPRRAMHWHAFLRPYHRQVGRLAATSRHLTPPAFGFSDMTRHGWGSLQEPWIGPHWHHPTEMTWWQDNQTALTSW